jgi:hypothetical protein
MPTPLFFAGCATFPFSRREHLLVAKKLLSLPYITLSQQLLKKALVILFLCVELLLAYHLTKGNYQPLQGTQKILSRAKPSFLTAKPFFFVGRESPASHLLWQGNSKICYSSNSCINICYIKNSCFRHPLVLCSTGTKKGRSAQVCLKT